ncbi:MAG: hypothetical protein ACXADY_27150 [Candidatus Hodarchaeales archaeon]|jgi:hypothetical protein
MDNDRIVRHINKWFSLFLFGLCCFMLSAVEGSLWLGAFLGLSAVFSVLMAYVFGCYGYNITEKNKKTDAS